MVRRPRARIRLQRVVAHALWDASTVPERQRRLHPDPGVERRPASAVTASDAAALGLPFLATSGASRSRSAPARSPGSPLGRVGPARPSESPRSPAHRQTAVVSRSACSRAGAAPPLSRKQLTAASGAAAGSPRSTSMPLRGVAPPLVRDGSRAATSAGEIGRGQVRTQPLAAPRAARAGRCVPCRLRRARSRVASTASGNPFGMLDHRAVHVDDIQRALGSGGQR